MDELDDDLESLDFTGITIEEEKDPVDAAVEEAAIAFANGDTKHCEVVLKDSVKVFDGMPGCENIWLMLFDLYRATGQREPFTAIELVYAKHFEKQPPVWRDMAAQVAAASTAGGSTLFKGDLVSSNLSALEVIANAVEKPDKVKVDLSRVKEIDSDGADRLLSISARAKKLKRPLEITGLDTLVKLLDPRIKARDPAQPLWFLMLECLQRQAKAEAFDELALEFAISFEISPPAYEAPPAVKKTGAPEKAAPVAPPSDGAFPISGDMTGGAKIDGLEAYIAGTDKVVIDMALVKRIDFACAGVMFTSLQPAVMKRVPILIRNPSHLVAALLKVVGLGDVATIQPSKV